MYNSLKKAALEQQVTTYIQLTGCLQLECRNEKMDVRHFLIDFIFYRSFRFTEKLSRKNRVPKYHTSYLHIVSIIINFLHKNTTYVKINKLLLITIHY